MTEIDPLRFVLSCLFGPGPVLKRLFRFLNARTAVRS